MNCLATVAALSVVLLAADDLPTSEAAVKARRTLERRLEDLSSKMDDVERAYVRRQRECYKEYETALRGLLTEVMADGSLDEANRIDAEVARVKQQVTSLKKDATAKPPLPRERFRDLVGRWRFEWGSTGKGSELIISRSGKLTSVAGNWTLPLIQRNGRILCLNMKTEIMELIPHNGNIVILGWPAKRRDPFKDQPRDVGIAVRIGPRE